MLTENGRTLNSQEVREKITLGDIVSPTYNLEKRIQPASLDPIIGEDIFVLEPEMAGLFRSRVDEQVYRTLLRLPRTYRRAKKLDGFEIKRGSTYLIPLEDKVKLVAGESVKSSPKSTSGRLFVNTRMLTDYNPCFDEVNPFYRKDELLSSWLLVQPLCTNVILHPGLSLNQLRFFQGLDAQLSMTRVIDELKENNIIYKRNDDGVLEPASAMLSDGIQVHLDLTGRHTQGIVGLRLRRNQDPVDLGKRDEYNPEDYFEPIMRGENGNVLIRRDEHYLFATSEVLRIPPKLNVELRRTSHIGIRGDMHFAGFIDPYFTGDLVLEVKHDEAEDVMLNDDKIPISTLALFSNNEPDKRYGDKEKSDSSYQDQLGPRPARCFRSFDYTFAARNYDKMSRVVLTQDTRVVLGHRRNRERFEFIQNDDSAKLMQDLQEGIFHSRYDCESDNLVLQIIPYVVIFDRQGRVFTYKRATDRRVYVETGLFGNLSIGVGGHIIQEDAPNYALNCLERKLAEEVDISGEAQPPELVGTLMAYDRPVDSVHFGLIYTMHCDYVREISESMSDGKLVNIDELMRRPSNGDYEVWSRELIPKLRELASI